MPSKSEQKAFNLKKEAEDIALKLVEHAKETARQMLVGTNLDTSKIPLICEKIKVIQVDIGEIKDHIKDTSKDHEMRIRWIESNIWKWIGVTIILTPIFTIAIAWLLSYLKNG